MPDRAPLILLALVGALAAPVTAMAAPPEAGVQEALDDAAAPTAQLDPAGSVESLGVEFRRFEQEVGGVPVLDSEVVVADPPSAPAVVVAESGVPALADPPAPELDRADAIRVAEEAVGLRASRAETRAKLAVDPGADGGVLVWRALIPARRPYGDFEVLVDALTGEVRGERDLIWRVRGEAAVFLPNPVVTNGGNTAGLVDAKDADSPQLTALRVPVQLPRLKKAEPCLRGAFAEATLKTEPVCRKSRAWSDITRADDRFEALMAYFHVDRTQAYVRSLGFRKAGFKGQPILANAIKEDNSGYSPLTETVALGRGGVDDGEDADTITHEYAHAIQDAQVPLFGQSAQSGAIGEGFADYVAAMMTAAIPGASPEAAACVFEWDGVPLGLACIRRTDKPVTLAEVNGKPCMAEIHCAGETWSGALWTLRGQLGGDAGGRPVVDRLVFQSNFALRRKATFREAANAVIDADDQLYGGIHRTQLHDEFVARGFLG
jgi:fungalysin metallopeptidase (M36)